MTEAKTVDEAIDSLGFGKFTITLISCVGIFYMGEASELNLISIISPELRCLWNLTPLETSFLSSMTFLGLFVGNVFWGYMSDIYGRNIFLVIGAFIAVYFGLLTTVSQGYRMFLVIRLFVGIGLGASIHVLNFIGEFVSTKHRGKSVVCVEFFYAFGSIYVSVTGMLLMKTVGWRIYILVTTVPPALFFLISFWLPESIHYLQNTDKYDEIVKTLNRISIMNNVSMPSLNFECKKSSKRDNVAILLGKEYRLKIVLMLFSFIAGIGGYYGLVLLNTEILSTSGFCPSQTVSRNHTIKCHQLSAKDYKASVIVTLAELPGILIPALVIDWIGRKGYLAAGFVISGMGFLCLNFCLSQQAGTILMFILRTVMVGCSQVPFVVAIELFPTVVRATAIGILSGSARVFMIIVPFLIESLYHTSILLTTGLFASLCFIAAFTLLFIPETQNSTLKNT